MNVARGQRHRTDRIDEEAVGAAVAEECSIVGSGHRDRQTRRFGVAGFEQRVHTRVLQSGRHPRMLVAAHYAEHPSAGSQARQTTCRNRRTAAYLAPVFTRESFLPGLRPRIEPAENQVNVKLACHQNVAVHAPTSYGHSRTTRARTRYAAIPSPNSPTPAPM